MDITRDRPLERERSDAAMLERSPTTISAADPLRLPNLDDPLAQRLLRAAKQPEPSEAVSDV